MLNFVNKSGDKAAKGAETTPEQKLIALLQKKTGGEQFGDRLNVEDFKTFIAVRIPLNEQKNYKTLVEAAFAVHNPLFDEDIIESVVGVGKDLEQALNQAAENFYNTVWCSFLAFLSKKYDSEISADMLGVTKKYNVLQCQTIRIGKKNEKSVPLCELVKPILHKYIGKKPVYWIKLFVSRNGDDMITEARVNGALFPSLAEPLAQYVKLWGKTDGLIAEKEFFFVSEEEEETLCDYDRKHVFDCVNKIIPLFIACDTPDKYKGIFSKIRDITGNINLAAELYTFIPEITCRFAVGFKEGDSLVIMRGKEGTLNPVEVKKSQIRSYGYAEKAVMEYLVYRKPSQDEVLRIINVSATYNAIGEALNNGSKLEDLYIPNVAFHVADDYVIE